MLIARRAGSEAGEATMGAELQSRQCQAALDVRLPPPPGDAPVFPLRLRWQPRCPAENANDTEFGEYERSCRFSPTTAASVRNPECGRTADRSRPPAELALRAPPASD